MAASRSTTSDAGHRDDAATGIDTFMPLYHHAERHTRVVRASPAAVRAAVDAWEPRTSRIWGPLMRLRGLGAPRGNLRQWAESMGFLTLAESETSIIVGQAGRFWSLRERDALVSPRTLEDFLAVADPESASAVMSVGVEPHAAGTLLVTETRIRALGPHARWRFRLYWTLIRPFSSLMRASMLRGIAALAERGAPA